MHYTLSSNISHVTSRPPFCVDPPFPRQMPTTFANVFYHPRSKMTAWQLPEYADGHAVCEWMAPDLITASNIPTITQSCHNRIHIRPPLPSLRGDELLVVCVPFCIFSRSLLHMMPVHFASLMVFCIFSSLHYALLAAHRICQPTWMAAVPCRIELNEMYLELFLIPHHLRRKMYIFLMCWRHVNPADNYATYLLKC